jgi:hypothetical protein
LIASIEAKTTFILRSWGVSVSAVAIGFLQDDVVHSAAMANEMSNVCLIACVFDDLEK